MDEMSHDTAFFDGENNGLYVFNVVCLSWIDFSRPVGSGV
jgi:hypothetical protein